MKSLSIYKKLLAHQWKESFRHPMFEKNMAVNILMGFFFLYMLGFGLFLGFMLPLMLEEVFDRPPVEALNGILIYTLIGSLFIRFFVQRLPLMDITRYLHLPIRKGTLLHYVFLKTFFSFFNVLPIVLLFPFFFVAVVPEHSLAISLLWVLFMASLILFNNLLAFYLKKAFSKDPWFVTAFGGLLVGLFLLNYYGWLDLIAWSHNLFNPVLKTPLLVLIPCSVVVLTYGLVYRWAKGFLRSDIGVGGRPEKVKGPTDLGLQKFGTVGRMVSFELDMIRRNKRPRTFALVAFLFLLYGLIFYPNPAYEGSYTMKIFVGVFTTGIFMAQFGQLHFAWDSPHFDKLLTSRLRIRDYILSKYVLMIASCGVMFVLSLPYAYFGFDIILVNFCAMLYNIGFCSILFLFLAMFNRRGMNLSKSNMFNYEGFQASQFLVAPLMLGFPLLIYGIFYFFLSTFSGLLAIGAFGFLCLLLHPLLFPVLERMFRNRKHLIAEGFRTP